MVYKMARKMEYWIHLDIACVFFFCFLRMNGICKQTSQINQKNNYPIKNDRYPKNMLIINFFSFSFFVSIYFIIKPSAFLQKNENRNLRASNGLQKIIRIRTKQTNSLCDLLFFGFLRRLQKPNLDSKALFLLNKKRH